MKRRLTNSLELQLERHRNARTNRFVNLESERALTAEELDSMLYLEIGPRKMCKIVGTPTAIRDSIFACQGTRAFSSESTHCDQKTKR